MKIGVDAGCLGITDERLKVGVYVVVSNMLKELGKIDKKNEYLLYSFYPIDKKLMSEFGKRMKNVVIPSIGWLTVGLPLRLLIDKPDLFLAANQALPLQLPLFKYKVVGLFYDIAFEKYPNLYSYAAKVSKHRNTSRYLSQHANKIIAISDATKNDVHTIYRKKMKDIITAYPGVVPLRKIKKQSISRKPYFLFVGAYKKSKNIPVLLQAFVTFYKKVKKNYQLILVGGDKWLDPEIEKIMSSLDKKTQRNIVQLGFVSDEKLANLYKNAMAFVSPSLYEGFGLPFLEAQAYGCPVIGSNRGALPEVIGESGILVNPMNIEKIAGGMKNISEDKKLRSTLRTKGWNNIQKYSWKSFAKRVQSAIEHA